MHKYFQNTCDFAVTPVHTVPGWAVPADDAWKHLSLQASDAGTLVNVRAAYIIQLAVTLASRTSRNLKPMFKALERPHNLRSLSDMDSCLLSCEAMNSCWCAALTDLLAHGRFDIKHVLQEANVPCVTPVALALGLSSPSAAVANGDEETDDRDSTSALFSWTELLKFGSTDTIPPADQLVRLQLFLHAELISFANETESKYRDMMCVLVEQDQKEGTKRRGHNVTGSKSTVLFKLDDTIDLLRSAQDENLLFCKLPNDFRLIFFGNVSLLAQFM